MLSNSISHPETDQNPIIVAVEMGYGHLRAAHTLAESFGTGILRMDLPPVAAPVEAALWHGMRKFYNCLSQACDWPMTGSAAKVLLEKITEITPLKTNGHFEPATMLARVADKLTGSVVGQGLRARAAGRPLLATYPAAAMAASRAPGSSIFCLATDTDLNRAWASPKPMEVAIEYLAPVQRVVDRLRSFGVPQKRIHLTGFPLPEKLVANSQSSLARRIHRLDPTGAFRNQMGNKTAALFRNSIQPSSVEPIALTLAIGGAGSQIPHLGQILKSLRKGIQERKFRLTLVAGTRADVAETLGRMVQAVGLSMEDENVVKVLFAARPEEYFRLFEDCLENTDLLWTKPSELVFYAALGLPILLAPPLGGQEYANRKWLLSNDAACDSGDPALMDQLIDRQLAAGDFCRLAVNGYLKLDRNGLVRIREILESAGGTLACHIP